jgi:hypothetical protein
MLILTLILALLVFHIHAGNNDWKTPKPYKCNNYMTVISDDITITTSIRGAPQFTIASNEPNSSTYAIVFDSMLQESSISGNQNSLLGESYVASNYKWTIGNATTKGSIVSFPINGTRWNYPSIAFVVHVNATGLNFKFDVVISNFQDSMWEQGSIGVTTCYTMFSDQSAAFEKSSHFIPASSTRYIFGTAELSIIPFANLFNSSEAVNATIRTGDSANLICISYGSFQGLSTGLIHDPTVSIGVISIASSMRMNTVALILCFALSFILCR